MKVFFIDKWLFIRNLSRFAGQDELIRFRYFGDISGSIEYLSHLIFFWSTSIIKETPATNDLSIGEMTAESVKGSISVKDLKTKSSQLKRQFWFPSSYSQKKLLRSPGTLKQKYGRKIWLKMKARLIITSTNKSYLNENCFNEPSNRLNNIIRIV